ncbi:unnamed protein product [Acanthoscelides obtectus]|uniref:XRCC4 N-terminal domain-containing protein n=1 Tax=Acanthoscelides obtectus TaxID=200917 RepID=A0A9P0JL56_ACAOB|nr:unnamed protein product [Acanthoscelides obtectus]CAK1672927.1 hypothetical protein AOBTE_LOCUS29144 [Acanthoscelides obtectus]
MKHIFKEVAGDKSGPFKIYSEINEDSLKIVVLEHLKAWSTDVKKEQITNLSKLLSVDPEKYFENLKLYLETDSTNVTYEVEGNKFVLYYKTGSNIKIKYFFHGLHPVDYFATVDGLLHEFFKDRALYLNEVTKLQSQNSELVKCK